MTQQVRVFQLERSLISNDCEVPAFALRRGKPAFALRRGKPAFALRRGKPAHAFGVQRRRGGPEREIQQ
jgi:hypothetical protein